MRFPKKMFDRRVAAWRCLSRTVAALAVVLAVLSSPARAHEVQPSVLDLTLADGTATVSVDATVEPFIAGLDLDGLSNTNESARSEANDRLRNMPPQELSQALRDAWPALSEDLQLLVDGTPVPLELQDIAVPEVGDPDLPRTTRFTATGPLPEGDAPVVLDWAPRLGGVAIRQMGAGQEGYTGYLASGGQSDPIPRTGGSAQGGWAAFQSYVPVGFAHIMPLGIDHILFVLGLFFLSMNLRPLLAQVTAFTAAHTLTLALAALGIVSVSAAIVEPLIAASIVYVGVENVLSRRMSPWRPLVVLLFGLLHGLGFAGVLSEYDLGSSNFMAKLIGFNVGVEFGQLAVIAAAFLTVGLWFGRKPWYKAWIANPASVVIAAVGAYWFVERVFL